MLLLLQNPPLSHEIVKVPAQTLTVVVGGKTVIIAVPAYQITVTVT